MSNTIKITTEELEAACIATFNEEKLAQLAVLADLYDQNKKLQFVKSVLIQQAGVLLKLGCDPSETLDMFFVNGMLLGYVLGVAQAEKTSEVNLLEKLMGRGAENG